MKKIVLFSLLTCALSLADKNEDAFKNALNLLENGTGVTLPENGKKTTIPRKLFEPLFAAFEDEFRSGPRGGVRKGRTAAPTNISWGNVAHVEEHLNLLKKHEGSIQASFGIDTPSLKLAILAHDIGKAFVDDKIQAFIASKTKDSKDFLFQQYVFAHDLHTIANISKVVSETFIDQNLDPKSENGKKLFQLVVNEIVEMVRYHNGVHVVSNMSARYPGLKEEEIAHVSQAWWPRLYSEYADKVGAKKEYGMEGPGAINTALNFLDRATLTTYKGPSKLLRQEIDKRGFTRDLIQSRLVDAAMENESLVRAQAIDLKRFMTDPKADIFKVALVKDALDSNTRVVELGKKILEMNEPVTLETLNVPESERTLASLGAAGAKQYVYYKTTKSKWYRIEGSNSSEGVLQELKDGKWTTLEKPVDPVARLIDLAKEDGLWS